MRIFPNKRSTVGLILTLCLSALAEIANGQTGSATQVGGADNLAWGGCSPTAPGPGEDAGGQVRISDAVPFAAPSGFDLRSCQLTFNNFLFPGGGPIEILADVGPGGSGADLVRDTPALGPVGAAASYVCGSVPPFLAPGFVLAPKAGGKPAEVVFETDSRARPVLRLQVKYRGGRIEFDSGLRIDRACIDRGNPIFVGYLGWPAAPGTPLRTSFRLTCRGNVNINYAKTPFWRATAPSAGCPVAPGDNGLNLRTP